MDPHYLETIGPDRMESLLIILFLLSTTCQARPEDTWPIWGRVGDRSETVAEQSVKSSSSATTSSGLLTSTAGIEPTSTCRPPPVTLKDGRWSWGRVDDPPPTKRTTGPEFETIIPISTEPRKAKLLAPTTELASSSLSWHKATSPLSWTLQDGRWSWGWVESKRERPS